MHTSSFISSLFLFGLKVSTATAVPMGTEQFTSTETVTAGQSFKNSLGPALTFDDNKNRHLYLMDGDDSIGCLKPNGQYLNFDATPESLEDGCGAFSIGMDKNGLVIYRVTYIQGTSTKGRQQIKHFCAYQTYIDCTVAEYNENLNLALDSDGYVYYKLFPLTGWSVYGEDPFFVISSSGNKRLAPGPPIK
ncbi:MAG: hypothetical protein M1829_004238 [Trizodia sp. TS-e1964]|nr:MAG: hypothetical protein M1829_004238 [Trizodia sp. TS-e1964]